MSTTESTRNATTTEVAQMARALLREHGLSDWSFQFDNAKRRFGVCKHNARVISLSAPLVRLNSLEQARDTLLHEIAHALVGGRQGHGPVWKAMARKLGASTSRTCGEDVVTPTAALRLVCSVCGNVAGTMHRHPRVRRSCTLCGRRAGSTKFDVRFLLVVERNR